MKTTSQKYRDQRSQPPAATNGAPDCVWSALIPEPQWQVLQKAATALREERIAFALGGALALAHYTGRLRNTRDGDFFLLEQSAGAGIAALQRAGFTDYYDQAPYDRGWIFRGVLDETIVDLIWTTPNRLTRVTPEWLERSAKTMLRGSPFNVVPVEELIWVKLFVMQRSRCDWPDVLNILRVYGAKVDWKHLMELAGGELDLLRAALILFNWTSPPGALQLPMWVRKKFDLKPRIRKREHGALAERERVALLDSRAWYAAFHPETELMNA
jgi:hypothetical protein